MRDEFIRVAFTVLRTAVSRCTYWWILHEFLNLLCHLNSIMSWMERERLSGNVLLTHKKTFGRIDSGLR